MANTVQANVETNVKMNTSSFDEGTKKIINDSNEMQKAIESCFVDSSKMTVSNLKDISAQYDKLVAYINNNKNLFNAEQWEKTHEVFDEYKSKILELRANLTELKNSEREAAQGIAINLREVQNAFIEGVQEPSKLSAEQIKILMDIYQNMIEKSRELHTDIGNDGSIQQIQELIQSTSWWYDTLILKTKEYSAAVEGVNKEYENAVAAAQAQSEQSAMRMSEAIQDFNTQYQYLQSRVSDAVNSGSTVSESLKKELSELVTSLMQFTSGLENVVPTKQFEQGAEKVMDLKEKVDNLQTALTQLNILDATNNSNGGIVELANNANKIAGAYKDITDWSEKTAQAHYAEAMAYDKLIASQAEWIASANAMKAEREEVFRQPADFEINQGVELGAQELDILADKFSDAGMVAKKSGEEVTDYTDLINTLAGMMGLSSSEASKLIKALGITGAEAATAGIAIGALAAACKLLIDKFNEAREDLLEFAKSGLGAGVEGVNWFIDSLQDLVSNLEDALAEMEKFAEAGAEIQTSFYNINTTLNSEAGASITEFTHSLQDLYGINSSTLAKDLKEIVSGANSLGASTDEMVLATENMALMANDLSIFAGSFKKAAEDVGNAVAKGFVGRTSSLYGLLSKSEKDTLKSLNTEVERYNYLMERADRIRGRYVDYLNTEAGKVMQLKNQYSILTSNIERLVLGLYAKIAPVLTELLKAANAALTAIMKLFNIDIDESANTGLPGAADKITEALEETADAAKEAKRQLASFDDVIQIKEDKNSRTTADEIADLSDIDLSNLYGLENALGKVNDRWARFKQLLEDGKYKEAGYEFANQLAQMMEEIPWDEFKRKAREAAHALAEFFNGVNENKRFWKDLGMTIGEGINTAVEALLEFAKTFNFEQFGDSLGVAWGSFWDTFDEAKFAETAYRWIKGVFQTLNGFFKTRPLTKMMTSIGEILDEFFNNIDQKDIDEMAETLLNILNDVADAAVILLKSVAGNTPKLIEIAKGLISDLHEWVNGPGKKDLNDIGNSIVEIIREFNNSGLIQDVGDLIRDFMRELHWGDIVAEFSKTEIQLWWEKTKTWWYEKFQLVEGFIKQYFIDPIENNPEKLDVVKALGFEASVLKLNKMLQDGLIDEEQYKKAIEGMASQIGYDIELAGDEVAKDIEKEGEKLTEAFDNSWVGMAGKSKSGNGGTIDLTKEVNIDNLERRVEDADKKIKELSDIIDGLRNSSENLTEIIKELKNSSVIDKELEDFIGIVSTNIERAMTEWNKIEKGALDSLLQTYSDFLFEVQNSVNSVTDLFAGMSEDVTTSVTELTKSVEGLKTKIETTLTDTKSFSAGLTIMRNLREGLKQGWAEVKSWWNSSVAQSMTMTFNTPRGQFTNGFNIPRLMAAGGIVTGATNAIVGEAGREAVIPLENNNVMKDLAGEFAKALGNNGNNAPITIDLSKCQKTIYTRPELLSMGEHIVNCLKTYGVVISMEY